MKDDDILQELKRLKAIADIGLLYSSNEYEKERYLEIQQISFSLLSKTSGVDVEELKRNFRSVQDYPTAKVDIRGMILSPDKKILFVKESSDEKWSLPGGWGEIGNSPAETIMKECKEEAGLEIVPKKLLAVFDKRKHPHPPQLSYVYKMVFHCEAVTKEINKGFDVLDVQYFSIDSLPELSENRILKSQVELVYKKIINGDVEAYFD